MGKRREVAIDDGALDAGAGCDPVNLLLSGRELFEDREVHSGPLELLLQERAGLIPEGAVAAEDARADGAPEVSMPECAQVARHAPRDREALDTPDWIEGVEEHARTRVSQGPYLKRG